MNSEANEAGKPSIDAEKMNAELLTCKHDGGDGIIDVDFILLIFGIWLGLFVSFFALWTLGNKWGWW